jgi:hypothetical protein
MSDWVIWSEGGLTVWVTPTDDDGLTIDGQHLGPFALGGREYQHAITDAASDVPAVVAALGGAPCADVLALLAANAETIVCKVRRPGWSDSGSNPSSGHGSRRNRSHATRHVPTEPVGRLQFVWRRHQPNTQSEYRQKPSQCW